jgi:hypothetical protein
MIGASGQRPNLLSDFGHVYGIILIKPIETSLLHDLLKYCLPQGRYTFFVEKATSFEALQTSYFCDILVCING